MKSLKYIIALSLLSIPCFGGQYAGVELGTNNLELTNQSDSGLKLGYKAGIKYGYTFENGFRAEFDCSYRRNEFKTTYNSFDDMVISKEHRNFHTWSYMINAIYDVSPLSYQGFSPYLGVGVGYHQNTEHKKVTINKETGQEKLRDNRIAYQGLLGLKYTLAEGYSACVQYHYVLGQSHAKAHSLGLSVLKHF